MAAKKKPAAKRGASRYQAPAKKPVPGWFWLVCGLVIGGFMVFLFSLEPGRDEIKRSKVEQARATQASKAAAASVLVPRPQPVLPPCCCARCRRNSRRSRTAASSSSTR